MANGFLSSGHLRSLYVVGVILQILLTVVFLLLGAAIISDIAYMYDRQMFYGSEQVLVVAFWKSMIPLVGTYIFLMLVLHFSFKYNYKKKKKDEKKARKVLSHQQVKV